MANTPKPVRETAVNKNTYTATRPFEYMDWGTFAAGDTVALPDGWQLDTAQTESIHMQDKKAAGIAKVEYKPWRTVFSFATPVYGKDERGRPTAEQVGVNVRRAILPVI